MEIIDFKTACIITGYEYQLTDGENVYNIHEPKRNGFAVINTKDISDTDIVYHSEIGTEYWILARPLGRKIYKYTPINQIDAWLKDHFAIGFEPEWWKPIKQHEAASNR